MIFLRIDIDDGNIPIRCKLRFSHAMGKALGLVKKTMAVSHSGRGYHITYKRIGNKRIPGWIIPILRVLLLDDRRRILLDSRRPKYARMVFFQNKRVVLK